MRRACNHGGRLLLGLMLLVVSGIFTPAEAQFSNDYSYRREVNLVDAQVIGGPHTNFPVLISSTLPDLRTTGNGGKVENANGYDIIFTSDQAGTIQLAHEIERYVATTGEIIFWVRVESLVSTTSIYLFYGNSSIGTFQGDVTSNGVTGVWDNDYLGVWHLNEVVADEAVGATHFDSTPNNHHGTQQRNDDAAGQIGTGQDFDGTTDYIEDADGELYINGLTAYTLSLWIESDVTGTDRGFITGDSPDGRDEPFGLRYDEDGVLGGGNNLIKGGVTVSGQSQEFESSSNVQTTNWQYLSTTWSSGNQHALYIDGAPDTLSGAEPARTGSLNGSTLLRIGQAQRAGSQTYWDGRIDEVRLSSVVRNGSWTETEYNNQFSPAAFYVIAAEEISPVLTVDNVIVEEGVGLLFTVTLGDAAAGPFTVDVTLTDVTATGGDAPLVSPEDYDNVVATLNFDGTDGEIEQFTVATLDDLVLEPTETFTVSLNASDPQVVDTDTGSGTINDNDATFPAACNIFVDQDAYLKASSPGENHGTDVELSLQNSSGGDHLRPVYRYDLSAIPAGSLVVSAKAWYYITAEDSNGGVATVHRITDAWTEGGVNWSNTATDFDATVEGTFTPSASTVWASTHLTPLVQSWVNGSVPNEGVMLLINQTDTESKYTSKEWSTASERPCMEVTWSSAHAVTVDDVTEIEGTGLLFTVTLDNAVASAFTVDVTLADVSATGGAAPLVSPEDYDNVVATLNFDGTDGETEQFTVATLDDLVLEPTETFTVSLNASDPLVVDTDTGTGTLTDNDSAASVVNSTGDAVDLVPGNGLCDTGALNTQGATECTLRAAMQEANALAGADNISFNIPTTEPGYSAAPLSYTIQPGSALPPITEQLDIDGSTQPDFTSTPIIVLDGVSAGVGADGVELAAGSDSSTIRSLVINNFDTRGINVLSTNNTVAGNWIGLEADGVTAAGNGGAGIRLLGTATNNTIGGTTVPSRNIIAGNGGDGISNSSTGVANRFLGNSIYANFGLGIDLTNDGVTLNDVGDGDAGANDLLNFPELNSATVVGANVTVNYDLDVELAGDYRVEFFTNPSGTDPSNHGEGEVFASSINVAHAGSGSQNYNHTFPGAVGDDITATTTMCTDGTCSAFLKTSEFSQFETAVSLVIVKRAFLPDGTPIPTDATIPSGVEFKFMLYINNPGAALTDVSVRDALDGAFLYQPGTIQVDNSVVECAPGGCTAGEELTIFTAVDGTPFLSDALGDDVVSYAAPNIDAGDGNAGNLQLDINADAVWAILFSVKMP